MPKRWELKETNDAKMVGGKRVRGSGNRWNNPGDVRSDKYLIECKQTDKKSYSLTKERLDKVYEEALFAYKIPLFSVKIQDVEVMIMFKEDWEKMLTKHDIIRACSEEIDFISGGSISPYVDTARKDQFEQGYIKGIKNLLKRMNIQFPK